jgi:hypothetical protein
VHLPEGWHRETAWMNLFQAACGPPAAFTSTEVVYGVTGTDVTGLPECGVSP